MTYLTFTTDQQKCTLSAEYHIRKVWYPASLMLWMQGGWDAHMIHVCSFWFREALRDGVVCIRSSQVLDVTTNSGWLWIVGAVFISELYYMFDGVTTGWGLQELCMGVASTPLALGSGWGNFQNRPGGCGAHPHRGWWDRGRGSLLIWRWAFYSLFSNSSGLLPQTLWVSLRVYSEESNPGLGVG